MTPSSEATFASSSDCSEEMSCQEATTQADKILKYMTTPYVIQVAYFVVGAVGMMGNFLVMLVMSRFPSLRSTFTNKFIINQSLIDFSTSFFILVMNVYHDPAPEALGDGIAQDIYCIIWMTKLPLWGTFICSTFNLVSLTFERYLAIVYPLQHRHKFTNIKAYIIMVGCWVFGLSFQFSYIMATTKRENNVCKTFLYPSIFVKRLMAIVLLSVQYFIPLVMITFAYIRIFLAMHKSRDLYSSTPATSQVEARMKRAKKNTIKTLFKVFACFVCCWTPNQLFYAGYIFDYEFTDDVYFYHCSVLMVFCNCCINPFVYVLTYEQFQVGAVKCICCGYCKKCIQDWEEGTITGKDNGQLSKEETSLSIISAQVSNK